MKITHLALITALITGLATAGAATADSPDTQPHYIETPFQHLEDQVTQQHEVRHEFDDRISVNLPEQAAAELDDHPVINVEEVEKYTIQHHRDDHQGGGNDDDEEDEEERENTPETQTPYGVEQIYDNNLEETTGGEGIGIAVLDTGVDTEHLDLKNRVESCKTFEPSHPSPNRGGLQEGECDDGHGHGTHVAGTALADAGDDEKGIYGVAPEAELHAYKVLEDDGSGYADTIAQGIETAAENDVEIISMSLGGDQDTQITDSVENAYEQGSLVISSAGNSGSDLDTMSYPAAQPESVSVAAIDEDYRVADFSSRGTDVDTFSEQDRVLEISAGGVNTLSTMPDNEYDEMSGTSMAAPHISGLAAKIWSEGDYPSNTDLRNELQDKAEEHRITDGIYTEEEYDPASGIGLPTLQEE